METVVFRFVILLVFVGIMAATIFFQRTRTKHPRRTLGKISHSVLALFLWLVYGIFLGWYLIAVVYDEHVERIESESFLFASILTIAAVVAFIGYRVSRPAAQSIQSTEKAVRPAQELASVPSVHSAGKTAVFVSYRRDDSADVTGRIYDRLIGRFGTDQVFKDVDSIPLGRDFRQIINDAVAKASVVIVVVGRNWLGREKGAERTRIHQQTDFVRTEVAAALQQDKPVIPVLVGNAKMPSEDELPDDVKPFVYRNAVNVRPDPDFAHDVERLIKGIEQA